MYIKENEYKSNNIYMTIAITGLKISQNKNFILFSQTTHGAMVNQLDSQTIVNEFDSHWVLHDSGCVLHLS